MGILALSFLFSSSDSLLGMRIPRLCGVQVKARVVGRIGRGKEINNNNQDFPLPS
jgi:hypothetical protein